MTNQATAALALCSLILASPGPSQAGEKAVPISTLELPTRVQLTTADGRDQTLDLLRIDPDLFLARKADQGEKPIQAIPRADVQSARVSLGRDQGRSARKGALIGVAVGAALWGPASICPSNASECFCSGGGCMEVAPFFLGAGAGLGAGFGAVFAGERWAPLELPPLKDPPPSPPPARKGK